MARDTKRRARPRNLAGLFITLALHAGLLGAIKIAHSKGDVPLEVPRDFVVAKLVKLGKPREKFWLPRITQPPRPKAPPSTIKGIDTAAVMRRVAMRTSSRLRSGSGTHELAPRA